MKIIALLSIMLVTLLGCTGANVITTSSSDASQILNLGFQNGNYHLSEDTVKVGEPVKLIVDTDKVKGCGTSIVSPQLGINKRVTPGDNIITFTPKEKGSFAFSCSMGMYKGVINVE